MLHWCLAPAQNVPPCTNLPRPPPIPYVDRVMGFVSGDLLLKDG